MEHRAILTNTWPKWGAFHQHLASFGFELPQLGRCGPNSMPESRSNNDPTGPKLGRDSGQSLANFGHCWPRFGQHSVELVLFLNFARSLFDDCWARHLRSLPGLPGVSLRDDWRATSMQVRAARFSAKIGLSMDAVVIMAGRIQRPHAYLGDPARTRVGVRGWSEEWGQMRLAHVSAEELLALVMHLVRHAYVCRIAPFGSSGPVPLGRRSSLGFCFRVVGAPLRRSLGSTALPRAYKSWTQSHRSSLRETRHREIVIPTTPI